MILKIIVLKNIRKNFSTLILNVAEKNDAAKMISKLLSNNKVITTEGFSKYNKLYNFKYELNGTVNDMIMTSVSGHLMNLVIPQHLSNWQNVDPVTLFNCQTDKVCLDSMKMVKESLEEIATRCQRLIIWTDCDREGENIGMEIVDVCLAINSKIEVKRARFSEITTESVTRAIKNLVNMDLKVSKAVDVRQELDLKTGAAFSRLQTLRLQKKIPSKFMNNIISYGSCQFPTLGFVVDRYKKITEFISTPFWKIIVTQKTNDSIFEYNWSTERSLDENTIKKSLAKITQNGSLACVTNVVNRKSIKKRPFALDTIRMEKLASDKLRMTPKLTMQIAEMLYSQGFISYPRTETNIFSKEVNLHNFVTAQTSDSRWGDFAKKILINGITPNCGNKNDNAHPPIIPLKMGLGLEFDANRLFELITRHFLACLSKDAQSSQTEIFIDCISKDHGRDIWKQQDGRIVVSGLGEEFSLIGTSVLERNYLDVYPYENWLDKCIPTYKIGDIFEPSTVGIRKGKTSPPSFLTDGDLISLMDKYGIGTDATHAEHIYKIKIREYVCDKRPKFTVPSKLGIGLVDAYNYVGINLAQPTLRSKFEADLKEICHGTKDPDKVLRQYLNEYKSIFLESVKNFDKLEDVVVKYLKFGDPLEIAMPTVFPQTGNVNQIIHDFVFGNADKSQRNNVNNCFCGERATCSRTLGKLIYKCKNQMCDYFLLIENDTDGAKKPPKNEDVKVTNCFCGKPAKIHTTMKDTQNKGRQFYTCNQKVRCQYFYWLPNTANSKYNRNRSVKN